MHRHHFSTVYRACRRKENIPINTVYRGGRPICYRMRSIETWPSDPKPMYHKQPGKASSVRKFLGRRRVDRNGAIWQHFDKTDRDCRGIRMGFSPDTQSTRPRRSIKQCVQVIQNGSRLFHTTNIDCLAKSCELHVRPGVCCLVFSLVRT